MCGIAGFLDFQDQDADPSTLQAMTDALAHRGPDGQGIHCDGFLGLGHRRLAIVDTSADGAQPMLWPERKLAITFNGEIFNFRELRRDLAAKGHAFHSQTDTEVILHAYAEWGEDCLSRFNGMFAFALWDGQAHSLWLVRDRLGVKPLFYAQGREALVFASEIKALLRHPSVARNLNLEGLAYYLALNYSPIPHTLFQGIHQVLPGTALRFHRDGRMTVNRYWDWQPSPEAMPESEAKAGFADLFEDSVRLRMLADVPVGCFLSGGVDSSAIAWAASRPAPPLQTFCIGFSDARFDERPRARAVAGHFGTRHRDAPVDLAMSELLPKIVWHSEEPTADSSMLGVYQLAALARGHVKVALSGDGADELLAGYPTYGAFFWHGLLRRLPSPWLRMASAALLRVLPQTGGKVAWDEKARRFIAALDVAPEAVHGAWRIIHNAAERQALLAPAWHLPQARADALDLFRNAYAETKTTDALARLLRVDTALYLPSDMLVKADRMGMAHGLEIRTPFLDYRLVEWLGRVPSGFKLRRGQGKWLLRKYLEGKMPKGMERGRKRGFNMPKAHWLRGEMKTFLLDHLSQDSLRPIPVLDGKVISQRVAEHLQGKHDHSHSLWGLLVFKLWWDAFLNPP